MRRLPVVFTLAFGLAAPLGLAVPSRAAAEGAEIERLEITFPLGGVTYFPCAGEVIEYSGSISGFFQSTHDATGGVHAWGRDAVVRWRGVGLTSGMQYLGMTDSMESQTGFLTSRIFFRGDDGAHLARDLPGSGQQLVLQARCPLGERWRRARRGVRASQL